MNFVKLFFKMWLMNLKSLGKAYAVLLLLAIALGFVQGAVKEIAAQVDNT